MRDTRMKKSPAYSLGTRARTAKLCSGSMLLNIKDLYSIRKPTTARSNEDMAMYLYT